MSLRLIRRRGSSDFGSLHESNVWFFHEMHHSTRGNLFREEHGPISDTPYQVPLLFPNPQIGKDVQPQNRQIEVQAVERMMRVLYRILLTDVIFILAI